MARPKKQKPEVQAKDLSRVLFLSLNMILLAFFILLVALSQPDKTKEAEIAIEVKKAFQSFGGPFLGLGQEVEQSGISKERNPIESSQAVERFLGELTYFVEENEEAKAISYEVRKEGLKIHLPEAFAFMEGSDQMLKRALPVLEGINRLILRTANKIHIEGHSDNREGAGKFNNAWELSAARATAVFRYLHEVRQLPANRFAVVGYGSQKPRKTNITEQGRSGNRRVTITLIGNIRRQGEGQ